MQKIKILYLVSTLKRSGPSFQLFSLIKYLDRNLFDPFILTLSKEDKNSLKDNFEKDLNVKIFSLSLSRLKGVFFAKAKINSFIHENKIDVVHTSGIRADSFLDKIECFKISTIHNYPYIDYKMKFNFVKATIMIWSHIKFIRSNQKVCFSCSKSVSQEFKKNNIDISYVQNGVDTQYYHPIEDNEIEKLKQLLGFNSKKRIFITSGNLIKRKNMETVINAFNKFNDQNNFILIIAGDGPDLKKLKELASKDIYFLGHISNLVQYLQISDYFISASLAEGLPYTVLEAMACGLPAMLSKIPSHLELYENKKGLFFEPKNIKELTKLMSEVSNNKVMKAYDSLKIIQESFTAKIMSKKYQDLYKQLPLIFRDK